MTRPYPGGSQLNWRPQLLRERPAHALGIALVVSEWAALEDHLISAFCFCLFTFQAGGHQLRDEAYRRWWSTYRIHQRVEQLLATAKDRIPEPAREHFRDVMVPRIKDRANERNDVAHAQWHVSDACPDEIVRWQRDPEQWICYSVADFDAITTRMVDTSNEIATFWHAHMNKPTFPPLPNWSEE